MSRYNTFKKFKEYKKSLEKKNIDQLCDKKNTKFELQSQQYFLKDYFNENINNIKQFFYITKLVLVKHVHQLY